MVTEKTDRKRITVCIVAGLILLFAILVCGCIDEEQETASNQSAFTVTDALGNQLSFSSHPKRIAVAGADIATVIHMLGAEDQVVSVGDPVLKDPQIAPYYKDKESLGDWSTLNTEKIVSVKPDLLLVYASSQPSNIEALKQTGITVGYFDCYKQNRLSEDITALGRITGKEDRAHELAAFIDNVTALVNERTNSVSLSDRPCVYFERGDYSAAANQSGGDWLITTAGGRNIAGNTTLQWVTVTPEWIVHENPDLIIKNVYVDKGNNLSDVRDKVLSRPGFSTINAVQSGRVCTFDSDMLYGPQSCISLLYVAAILYPDRFTDVNPDRYLEEFTRRFYQARNDTPVMYPPLIRQDRQN